MLFRTHLAFGIFLFFLLFRFVPSYWFFLVGLVVGVLFVDIDSSWSKVGRRRVFRPLQFFLEHRGAFHSLFVGFVVMILLTILDVWLSIGFFVGFISHLLLDSLTPSGVMLFWPISTVRFRSFVRTGGFFEDVFFIFLLVADCIFFIYTWF